MTELYWIYIGTFGIWFLIGIGSGFWRSPAKKPAVEVGALVRIDRGCIRPRNRAVYRVTGVCECPGHGHKRALFVQRVTPGAGALSAWIPEHEARPAIVEFAPPSEEEACELNLRFGITCATPHHASCDCGSKARQRIALGLPGHQQ